MKKRIAALVCLLLVWMQVSGLAEAVPGQYAKGLEAQARLDGMQLRTETSFAWGGLPLLDDETNEALKSLLKVLVLEKREQGTPSSGYLSLDVLLQKVSVLDLSMQNIQGTYYEQSNLLGGQTVAFTPEEFQTFVARLSSRSQGAMPTNLDAMFSIVMQALGAQPVEFDVETMSEVLRTYAGWQDVALQKTERLRPEVAIPGLYGLRAEVVDVTREEALAFADAYSALLAENEALWRGAAHAQQPDATPEALQETAKRIAETLRVLPDMLAAWLPDGLPPAEYREVYGADDALVCRQLDITLPDDVHAYVEWVPEEAGVPAAYALISMGGSTLEFIYTQEVGAPQQNGSETKALHRTVAQGTYREPGMEVNAVLTTTRNASIRAGKEAIATRIELMMESEALFGEGAVITLSGETTETASGAIGSKYVHSAETVWRLKGLGFDSRKILTVSQRTTMEEAAPPATPGEDVVRPAQLSDEELDEWLDGTQVSLMQTLYTILGRLPANVAAYVLKLMQGSR